MRNICVTIIKEREKEISERIAGFKRKRICVEHGDEEKIV